MKKYDLIKMAGWIAVAIGGLVASWATDKQSKEEIDKKLEEYITEKTDKEEILYIRRIGTPFFIWRNTSRNICPVRLFGCIPDIYGKKFEIYLV